MAGKLIKHWTRIFATDLNLFGLFSYTEVSAMEIFINNSVQMTWMNLKHLQKKERKSNWNMRFFIFVFFLHWMHIYDLRLHIVHRQWLENVGT